MSAPTRICLCLCLLVAAPVAVADEAPRYSGQATLTPAEGRFSLRARLVAADQRAASRYQLSGRLAADAHASAVSAVCVDDVYRNGFE